MSTRPPLAAAELVCRTAFSFHEGASLPEETIDQAAELGLCAVAIADRDAVYAIPRAHKQIKRRRTAGLPVPQLICGALITIEGGPGLVLLAQTTEGWKNLCRLITQSRCGSPTTHTNAAPLQHAGLPHGRPDVIKGRGRVALSQVCGHAAGLEAILMGTWSPHAAQQVRDAFGTYASIGLVRRLDSQDAVRMSEQLAFSQKVGLPLVATCDVQMHHPDRKQLQDVLTCIRRKCTIDSAGRALCANRSRHLRSPASMHRMFKAYPHAVARTTEIAARCLFSLDDLAYLYPHELVPPGHTPMEHLRDLTQQGLAWRYPNGVDPSVQHQVNHELAIIERLNFPAYFLTVHDTVRFARERDILCQGRGSAANSAVCYALGITVVDPAKSNLLFERFISDERGEPPDIDVDFEHERREEVIQYVYQKYGRHRAAMVCEIITYRRRSAVRDVGKALGLSLDQVDRLAKRLYWFDRPKTGARNAISATQLQEAGLNPTDHRVQLTVALTQQLVGLPRHVGVHVGGFTISDGPLVDLCPIEPATMNARTVIQWDKDDVDTVGFVKVDLLSLGMLTATRKCFDLIAQHWGRSLTLASVPSEDPAVYDMLCQADSIGVFQVESRAQMSMLPRLKPRCWYDLVIEVSIVRPGPIQGGMVHPYLRRRRGQERVTYAHPALRPILERTMGVPIFQEQVMAMAVAVGGFTPGQADALRRAMGAWRKRGGLEPLTHKLIHGMRKNGISQQYAEQICAQIQGFGEYGFPESHAASFARLVYISAWLKCHYPGAFAAALINSQPMGFYSARSLASDAERHGVEIRPVHVNHSEWDCTLEPVDTTKQQHALRLGFRLIKGLRKDTGIAIANARQNMPYTHIGALARRADLNRHTIALLARTGSLEGLHTHTTPLPHTPATGNRRQALWAAQGLIDLPLFRGLMRDTVPAPLPPPGPVDNMREDYALVGLSVGTRGGIQDPVGLIRPALQERGFVTAAQIKAGQPNSVIKVGGVITNRQRPGTASGMLFMTLEDETGMINLVVRPQTFKRQRRNIMEHNMLEVTGRIQRDGASVSVLCFRFAPMRLAPQLQTKSRDFR